MASRLTKSMYGWDPDPKKNLFGLTNNQVRVDGAINNAGWFNEQGERLGCGDLSLADMHRISVSLVPGEIFHVLTESNAVWDLPSDLERNAPGLDYVMQNSAWILAHNKIIRVKDDSSIKGAIEIIRNGVRFFKVNATDFHASINYHKQKDLKNKDTLVPDMKPGPVAPVKAAPIMKTASSSSSSFGARVPSTLAGAKPLLKKPARSIGLSAYKKP